MTRAMTRAVAVPVAIAAVVGSAFGLSALVRAVRACQNLYSVDLTASQLESELEFETQESRRRFLHGLATPYPEQRKLDMDAAQQTSGNVRARIRKLRALDEADFGTHIAAFENSWNAYAREQDGVAVELGPEGAAPLQSLRLQPAFEVALENLRALKIALASHSEQAAAELNGTLRSCASGLTAFALSTFVSILLLLRANGERRQAARLLHLSNHALQRAAVIAKQRSRILEMVSRHAPLEESLKEVAEFGPKWDGEAGVALWVIARAELEFRVAANLPERLVDSFRRPSPQRDRSAQALEELTADLCTRGEVFGFSSGGSRTLYDAGGQLIGMLHVFSARRLQGRLGFLADELAHLASIAIENSLLYEQLAFQAHHDPLTELPNRMLFMDRVEQALLLSARHDCQAAVMWVDLDQFKEINDKLGHGAGDEVLRQTARRLQSCLRGSDTVARIGGDEFTILAQDLRSAADAEVVAVKLLRAFMPTISACGQEIPVTASIGVALHPDHGADPVELLRSADLAMYRAKRAGGNTYRIFEGHPTAAALRQIS